MPSSRVSIVIPTYNRPQLVVRSIKSALAQTYEHLEVLVMDDSRNDDTANAVREIRDLRMKYRKNPERLNFVENKNQGVRCAEKDSRYIAFLDDDDEYLPLFLEKTVGYLDQHPEVFAVTTNAEFKTQGGESLGIYPCECESWRVTMGNGWVLRREIFFEDDIWFDPHFRSEDLDFGIAVARKHVWKCIPEPLRIYYGYPSVKGGSLSTSFAKEMPKEDITNFLKKNLDFYERSGPEALAWAHFMMGKMLCRSHHVKEGRMYFGKAFSIRPRATYAGYYLLALLFPPAFGNVRIMVLKNKLKNILR